MDVITVFIFLFGISIGSFLNVLIHRLPRGESVAKGRSRCLACEKTLAWYDLIPLVSYVLLLGKCRYCGARFSIRYFLVELITGLLWVFLWKHVGWGPELFRTLPLFTLFIAVTFTDFETGYIPDLLNFPGMVIGLLVSGFFPVLQGADHFGMALWRSLIGLLIGGGSILAMGVIGSFMFKKEAMGGGDVKLMAMIGAFLGVKLAILTLFMAPFFAMPFAIFTRLIKKEEMFPFGPFIAAAAVWAYFCGNEFLHQTFYF